MSDLSVGNHADVVLNAGDVLRVSTGGVATVVVAYGAPAGTTTITANTQDFGPYSVPAKLAVNAVTGTASYSNVAAYPVVKMPDGTLQAGGSPVDGDGNSGLLQKTPAASASTYFPGRVVDAPTGTLDYAGSPATAVTQSGRILVVYRKGSRHDLTSGGLPGPLLCKYSDDGGVTFSGPSTVIDFTASSWDVGDAAVAVGSSGEIYASTWQTKTAGNSSGLYTSVSTDNGLTWGAPTLVYFAQAAFGDSPRLTSAGWVWPIYEKIGGYYAARLLTASTPAGPWSVNTVLAPATTDITEWSLVEVSSTNWIGVCRNSTTNALNVVQSADDGATWSAATALAPATGYAYNGWPVAQLGLDGRVIVFVRANGQGIRVLQLLDTATPLTAANWSENGSSGGAWQPLDKASGANFAGCFKPVRIGAVWVGGYQVETTVNEASAVLFGVFDETSLNSYLSYIATSEKIADGAAASTYFLLTTPDRVVLRSPGRLYKIDWSVRSAQASGTVSNFQIDVFVDGSAVGDTQALFCTIGGSSRNTTSGYYDARTGVVYLPPGLHTIELRYKMDITTVGRSFLSRFMSVVPF